MSVSREGSVANREADAYPKRGEMDLVEFWRAILQGKWLIFAFIGAFSTVSIFYALSLTNLYKSTAVLAPAKPVESDGLGRLAGIASIAGINIGGGASNLAAEAVPIIGSWAFIEEFLSQEKIAPEVFAIERWDPNTKELFYDEEVYDSSSRKWTRDPPKGKQPEPSSWELYEVFSEMLTVGMDEQTGFYYITIESPSPELSKVWVQATRANTAMTKSAFLISIP